MKSVKHVMVDREWNQQDLAARWGVHHSYVSLVLAGKRRPSIDKLEKLAMVTRVPIQTLIAELGKRA